MVEAGYLYDLRAQQVYVDMSLDGLDGSRKRQDFVDEALGVAIVQVDAPSEIARAYIEFAAGRRGLCFAPNVETSKLIKWTKSFVGKNHIYPEQTPLIT